MKHHPISGIKTFFAYKKVANALNTFCCIFKHVFYMNLYRYMSMTNKIRFHDYSFDATLRMLLSTILKNFTKFFSCHIYHATMDFETDVLLFNPTFCHIMISTNKYQYRQFSAISTAVSTP